MQKALMLSTAVLLALLTLLVATAGAREKKKYKEKEDTIYGMIGCSIPPVAPAPGKPPNPMDTTALCLARKGQAVIVQDGGQTATPIENPEAMGGEYEGHRVSLSGYMNGQSFHVISVRVL